MRFALIALAAAVLLAFFADRRIRRPASEAARASVARAASEALAFALSEAVSSTELPVISQTCISDESFIISVEPNALAALTDSASALARERVGALGKTGVSVDLGSVSGSTLLSGRSSGLTVSFTPVGAVEAAARPKITSCGINQSLFTVELELSVSVHFLIAGRGETVQIKTAVPICETVVVGRVPQVYTNVAGEEDMLNLVPNELP